MKQYKLGMYIGRFQPFHNGHKSIVDKMMHECERVLIVVGSADKQKTATNPFSGSVRANLIRKMYPDAIVVELNDRARIFNDASWGDYVMDNLARLGYYPDAIYEGSEFERRHWYDNYPNIAKIQISRTETPISATIIRSAIAERNMDFIRENVPKEVANFLDNFISFGVNWR